MRVNRWIAWVASVVLLLSNAEGMAHAADEGVTGRWVSDVSPLRSVLVLRSDGTFQFDERNGEAVTHAEGTYQVVAGKLRLTARGAGAPGADLGVTLRGTTLVIDAGDPEPSSQTFRRDFGPIVGRWTRADGDLTLILKADGSLEQSLGGGAGVPGKFEIAYVEMAAERGSVSLRAGVGAPTHFTFSLEDGGSTLRLRPAGEAGESFDLVRTEGTTSPPVGGLRPPPVGGAPARPATETDLAGTWRAATDRGELVLEISVAGDSITVTSNGESGVARLTAPGRAEGVDEVEGGRIVFAFERRGARLIARFTLEADDGTPSQVSEIAFERAGASTLPGPAPRPVPAPEPDREAPLVGRWQAMTAEGVMTLVVEDRGGGAYRLISKGRSSPARLTEPGRLEGEEVGENGSARFVLAIRGGRLVMRVSVAGASGETQDAAEIVFDRAEASPVGGDRDPAIVGHWRHTSVETGVVDIHLELLADGTYRRWVNPSVEGGGPVTGTWRTEERRLYLRAESDGEWSLLGNYGTNGGTLLITFPNGTKRPYERS